MCFKPSLAVKGLRNTCTYYEHTNGIIIEGPQKGKFSLIDIHIVGVFLLTDHMSSQFDTLCISKWWALRWFQPSVSLGKWCYLIQYLYSPPIIHSLYIAQNCLHYIAPYIVHVMNIVLVVQGLTLKKSPALVVARFSSRLVCHESLRSSSRQLVTMYRFLDVSL